jgi:ketosteroid isomerase-like protein
MSVSGFSKNGPPSGVQTDRDGRLRTRLLQVFKKDGGDWKIVVYHNVDIKPGVPVPEPR